MAEGESAGKPEGGPQQGLEILDSEKLKNYGALYGRFLMASQAQPAEVANIINPTTELEFKFAEDKVPLDKRDYNPVFENLSLKERQDQWGITPYEKAKKLWQEQFTEFMNTKIEKGSNRELVLKIILPGIEAKKFAENDAETLFQKFCRDKSDTHKFISQITEHVVNNKINPTNLQELLPHLKWIASGLFGRQTAGMTAGLVDLESQLRNNSTAVLEIFNSNKQRINMPTDDEKRVLGSLYQSLIPQEKVPGPTQEIKPPPVAPEPDEGEDRPLAAPPAAPLIKNVQEKTPQPVVPENKTTNIPDSIINLEGKADLVEELNDKLSASETETHLTFRAPVYILKNYLISFAKSQRAKVKEGIRIEIGKDNKIAIRGIEITKSKMLVTGKINVDLILSNGPSGISAEIQHYKTNTAASMFGGDIKSKIKELDTLIKEALKRQLSPINRLWTARKLSIAGENILIEFGKNT